MPASLSMIVESPSATTHGWSCLERSARAEHAKYHVNYIEIATVSEKNMRPALAFVVSTLVAGCAGTEWRSTRSCSFAYTADVIRKLVIPELKSTYGGRYTELDLKSPGVVDDGDTVELIFGQSDPDMEKFPVDTDDHVVVVDQCATRVITGYVTSPFDDGK